MHDEADPSAAHADHPAMAARRLGEAATEATFGREVDPTGRSAAELPAIGLLVGEIGPKARASAALRKLERDTRARRELVPRGSSVPGMGWLLLLSVLAVVVVIGGVIALLVWATS